MVSFTASYVLIFTFSVLLLQAGYTKGILCIADESHDNLPEHICNATSQRCYVERKMIGEELVITRGCFKPSGLQPSCDTQYFTATVISCCSENLCNNQTHVKYVTGGTSTEHAQVPTLTTSMLPGKVVMGGSGKRLLKIILPVVLVLLVTFTVFIIIVCTCVVKKRTRKQNGAAEEMAGLGSQTFSSGSGYGLPIITRRTVSHNVTLCERIGTGRFGTVFVGVHQGEQVAVKKFTSRNELAWSRESEIYNTVWLHHDNVLGFVASDILSHLGSTELWLILDYHPHGSLYSYLSRQTVPLETMMRMAIGISRGLTFLHTDIHGLTAKPAVAHRDIKSANVLVKNSLECCLCDFGHAVVESAPNRVASPIKTYQGTRRYMSPEILAETMDVTVFEEYLQVDMYALGLVLWEICSRCTLEIRHYNLNTEYLPPFDSLVPDDPSIEDMRRVVLEQKQRPPIPPAWMEHKMMFGLACLMKECWYFNSTARPSSIYVKEKLLKLASQSLLNTVSKPRLN